MMKKISSTIVMIIALATFGQSVFALGQPVPQFPLDPNNPASPYYQATHSSNNNGNSSHEQVLPIASPLTAHSNSGDAITQGGAGTAVVQQYCTFNVRTFGDFIGGASCALNRFGIPILVSIELLIFIWGVVQYIMNSDSTEERAAGRKFMLWGIIALFVTVTLWGILAFLGNLLGFEGGIIPQLK